MVNPVGAMDQTVILPVYGAQNVQEVNQSNTAENAAEPKGPAKTGKIECQTCKNRRYVDGSNDSGVSFKTPGYIDPGNSAAIVSAHEGEHVAIAKAEGSKPGNKLISATVTLHTAICPECGRAYISGGETRTQIAYGDPKSKTGAESSVDQDIKGASFDKTL